MTKDPYKYFRIEARELLEALEQNMLALEKNGQGKESIQRILRLAHTLKGASRVVKLPDIAECCHRLEDIFEPFLDADTPVSAEVTSRGLDLLDTITKKIAVIEPTPPRMNGAVAHPSPDETFETVRIEIQELDALLSSLSETSSVLPVLRSAVAMAETMRKLTETLGRQITRSSPDRDDSQDLFRATSYVEELRSCATEHERNLASSFRQLASGIAQVHEATNRVRLVPVRTIFSALERAARDAGESLHKTIQFRSSGGDIRIDGAVLAPIRNALLHVVRNAVAHGIESAAERTNAEKVAEGSVEISVQRRGSWVAFVCRDDGQGIDFEAVRSAAIQKKLLTVAEAGALTHEDVVQLMLKGGITTSAAVDDVSGRGIGLDVVRTTAERLKGHIKIESMPGQGSTFEICVPLSLSSLEAIQVEAGGLIISVPLDGVRRTLRVADHDLARSSEKDTIICDDQIMPFVPLHSLLGKRQILGPRQKIWLVLVLESAAGFAAVGVDRLLGIADVVVKQLSSTTRLDAIVAGASLDAEGNPQLVLDPDALVRAVSTRKLPVASPASPHRVPILVIDDSLTTRMLEQSILEAAGYEVHLASSAEEGLAKARERRFGLFLVDVEMPGMDGFEFVSQVQADHGLREIPAILVTSRNAEADRRRGAQVGAQGYIVKGEFDQGHLLQMIHNLTG